MFNQCYHCSWYRDLTIYELFCGYFVFVDFLWPRRDDWKIRFHTEYYLLNVSDMSHIMIRHVDGSLVSLIFHSWDGHISQKCAYMCRYSRNVYINVVITPSRHILHWFKVPEPFLPVEQFVHIMFHCNYFCPLKSKYWPQLKTPCHHILHRQYIWKMSACC